MSAATVQIGNRSKVAAAVAASILIHLLLLFSAALMLSMHQTVPSRKESLEEPVELTFLPPPEPPARQFVDSSQSTPASKPSETAMLESDRDTSGASELPAAGSAPLPTTDGKAEQFDGLRDEQFALGAGNGRPTEQASPAAAAKQPATTASLHDDKPDGKASEPPSTQSKPAPRPAETELALLDPAQRKEQPRPREPEVRKAQRSAQPRPASPPGYQPQARATRLTGGFNNRGRASLEARATPLGRYQKSLSDAVGSRWYYYVSDMMGLVTTGTVQVRFVVRQNGAVEAVQVRQNSANESLASCSVRSILEAEIPPIPPDIAKTLNGGKLEIDYTFTVY